MRMRTRMRVEEGLPRTYGGGLYVGSYAEGTFGRPVGDAGEHPDDGGY